MSASTGRIYSMVLAGGAGSRLQPLTLDRAKPAVPFGGAYRMIDFVLSNLVNSGLRRIAVLTQYKSHSLERHISQTWRMTTMLGEHITPVPAQQRLGPHWYAGSADALRQSMHLLRDESPDHVVVFGADHIYRMDVAQMLDEHVDSGADCTVAALRVPRAAASAFGVLGVDASGRIVSFEEKPADPVSVPGDDATCLASMGNYVFRADALCDLLEQGEDDIGGGLVPSFVAAGGARVHDFATNRVEGHTGKDLHYWRDVGTIDAYHAAHMDLVSVDPEFNLYSTTWPIWTSQPQQPGAKFVLRGTAEDSIVTSGCVISGGHVFASVLSPQVRVETGAVVADSVLLHGVQVGEGAELRRAILDKGVVVEPGARVGVDPAHDRARGFTVSPGGVTVVGKGQRVAASAP